MGELTGQNSKVTVTVNRTEDVPWGTLDAARRACLGLGRRRCGGGPPPVGGGGRGQAAVVWGSGERAQWDGVEEQRRAPAFAIVPSAVPRRRDPSSPNKSNRKQKTAGRRDGKKLCNTFRVIFASCPLWPGCGWEYRRETTKGMGPTLDNRSRTPLGGSIQSVPPPESLSKSLKTTPSPQGW